MSSCSSPWSSPRSSPESRFCSDPNLKTGVLHTEHAAWLEMLRACSVPQVTRPTHQGEWSLLLLTSFKLGFIINVINWWSWNSTCKLVLLWQYYSVCEVRCTVCCEWVTALFLWCNSASRLACMCICMQVLSWLCGLMWAKVHHGEACVCTLYMQQLQLCHCAHIYIVSAGCWCWRANCTCVDHKHKIY
jgi:hypothetical protein